MVRGIHGTRTTRRREREHTRGERRDIHGKKTTWTGNYIEKGEGTNVEREDTRRGDTFGVGTQTRGEHTW